MLNTSAVTTKPTLIGDRIRLVPLVPRHAEAVYASLQDPETNRLTGTHRTFTYGEIQQFCATRGEQNDRLDMAIELLDGGRYVGGVVLNDMDAYNESAGFRIDLVSGFQGQGYGPEATRLLLRYGFDEVGLNRVQLEVFTFNERARRSYEKCGFSVEGRLRDALVWDGQRYDTLVMGVLRDEFIDG